MYEKCNIYSIAVSSGYRFFINYPVAYLIVSRGYNQVGVYLLTCFLSDKKYFGYCYKIYNYDMSTDIIKTFYVESNGNCIIDVNDDCTITIIGRYSNFTEYPRS